MVLVAVSKMGVVLHRAWSESQWHYYWDVLLSHQMLAAIKRVADVFQQDSVPVHCVHNIDQLLQHETQLSVL